MRNLADTDIHLIVKRQPMSVRICNILKNTGPIILILTLHVITIVFSTQNVPGGSFPYSYIEKGSAYIPGMYVGPFIISLYHIWTITFRNLLCWRVLFKAEKCINCPLQVSNYCLLALLGSIIDIILTLQPPVPIYSGFRFLLAHD